jgi:hypothetical protein
MLQISKMLVEEHLKQPDGWNTGLSEQVCEKILPESAT